MGPSGHPRIMKVGYDGAAPSAANVEGNFWHPESVQKLTWERPAPRIGAYEPAEQNRDGAKLLRPTATPVAEGAPWSD